MYNTGVHGFDKKIVDLSIQKIYSDYNSVVDVKTNTYNTLLAYKIYHNNHDRDNIIVMLYLTLNKYMRSIESHFISYVGIIVNDDDDDVDDHAELIYDYKSGNHLRVESKKRMNNSWIRCKKLDPMWISRGFNHFSHFIRSLIPPVVIREWSLHKICMYCLSVYKANGYDVKTARCCYRCRINDEVLKTTSVDMNDCSICLEPCGHIDRVSVCGDHRHSIHKTCYEKMILRRCPLCRREEGRNV